MVLLTIWFVVFPVAVAYLYTHTARTASTPKLGVASGQVTVTTRDSLELEAWYVSSQNPAAVIVLRLGDDVAVIDPAAPRGPGGAPHHAASRRA